MPMGCTDKEEMVTFAPFLFERIRITGPEHRIFYAYSPEVDQDGFLYQYIPIPYPGKCCSTALKASCKATLAQACFRLSSTALYAQAAQIVILYVAGADNQFFLLC